MLENSNTQNTSRGYSTHKLMDTRNPNFVKSMIALFVKSALEFVNDITFSKANKNLLSVQQLAHKLKASVDILDIKSVSTLVRELESSQVYNDELEQKINLTIQNIELVMIEMKTDFNL
jgi:HPt (histidine-containing phosphotransfer) domain-containing protein